MKYKTPPLPFLGNKTGQLKNIDEVLTNMQYAGLINEKTIFYDVFGGSGLISHHIKQRFKNNRVIWNDYDDYQSRLNLINKTNEIKKKIIKDEIYEKALKNIQKDKLNQNKAFKIHEIIDSYDEKILTF